MLRFAVAAGLALAAVMLAGPAEARRQASICGELDQMRGLCQGSALGQRPARVSRASFSPDPGTATPSRRARQRASYGLGGGQVIGGRPPGCPRAFCGCGASLHLFGRIIPSLNLAANWLRFPWAAPAPGMVAAKRGHVFVLEQHIAGDVWLAHDSNSGRHLTRRHPRSIAGYQIVNPHGGAQLASAAR